MIYYADWFWSKLVIETCYLSLPEKLLSVQTSFNPFLHDLISWLYIFVVKPLQLPLNIFALRDLTRPHIARPPIPVYLIRHWVFFFFFITVTFESGGMITYFAKEPKRCMHVCCNLYCKHYLIYLSPRSCFTSFMALK